MNENQNRCIFSLNGITGMLIATVLLLSILGVLTYLGIIAQQETAQAPYGFDRSELSQVKMVDDNNANLEAQIMDKRGNK